MAITTTTNRPHEADEELGQVLAHDEDADAEEQGKGDHQQGQGGEEVYGLGLGGSLGRVGLGLGGFSLFLVGRVLRVGFSLAGKHGLHGVVRPLAGAGDECLDFLGDRQVGAYDALLGVLSLDIRDSLKWSLLGFHLHDRVGLIDRFFITGRSAIDENADGRDEQSETKPNGPVVFLLPQV